MKKFTALAQMSTPVQTPYGQYVTFYAKYDPENDEHRKWAQATPSLNFQMNIKEGLELEPGEYVVTFEKVEKSNG